MGVARTFAVLMPCLVLASPGTPLRGATLSSNVPKRQLQLTGPFGVASKTGYEYSDPSNLGSCGTQYAGIANGVALRASMMGNNAMCGKCYKLIGAPDQFDAATYQQQGNIAQAGWSMVVQVVDTAPNGADVGGLPYIFDLPDSIFNAASNPAPGASFASGHIPLQYNEIDCPKGDTTTITTTTTTPTTTTTSKVTTTTTSASVGSCSGKPCKMSECRSQHGFCGLGSDYCNEQSIWSKTCGGGLPDTICTGKPCLPTECRSEHGFCGTGNAFCNKDSTWTKACGGELPKTECTGKPCVAGQCRSEHGYCGAGPDFCNGRSIWIGGCGGIAGRCDGEQCPAADECRSQHGYCGKGASYCNTESLWSPACTKEAGGRRLATMLV